MSWKATDDILQCRFDRHALEHAYVRTTRIACGNNAYGRTYDTSSSPVEMSSLARNGIARPVRLRAAQQVKYFSEQGPPICRHI
jgi:hypothetical protein